MRSLWTAASGMITQQQNVDIISNNLSNVNTTGFKKSRAEFSDLLYQTIKEPGATEGEGIQNPSGIQIGHGAKTVSTPKIFTVGNMKSTENPLDIAIEGDGFFQVRQMDGSIGYTRDGSFKINSEGQLVTSQGFIVEPEIVIPENTKQIAIGKDGTVSVVLEGESQPETIGQINIARFMNPAGLSSEGHNLYNQTAASGDPIITTPGQEGTGMIAQGTLEMSNVSIVDEMVKMITAQRAYEINSKSIKTSDDMMSIANNLKR